MIYHTINKIGQEGRYEERKKEYEMKIKVRMKNIYYIYVYVHRVERES